MASSGGGIGERCGAGDARAHEDRLKPRREAQVPSRQVATKEIRDREMKSATGGRRRAAIADHRRDDQGRYDRGERAADDERPRQPVRRCRRRWIACRDGTLLGPPSPSR